MIDCRQTLLQFYDYLDRQLPELQAREVEEHLAACKPCFDRMEFERHFSRFLQREGQVEVDAEALKARLLEKLRSLDLSQAAEAEGTSHGAPTDAKEQAHALRRTAAEPGFPARSSARLPAWSYALVAVSLLFLIMPIWMGVLDQRTHRPSLPATLAPLAAIHESFRPQFRHSEAGVLAAWIRQNAGHDPMVQPLASSGCALVGASVDSIWAVMFAEQESIPFCVFVASNTEFSIPGGLPKVERQGHEFHVAEAEGLAFVLWEYPPDSLVCAAVARADAGRLLALVLKVEELATRAGS